MAVPVKVSEKLMALAKVESANAHRSATAQIEHWATLGRAVEAMAAYREVLALKRLGLSLPLPGFVMPEDVHTLLSALVSNDERSGVKARIAEASPVRYESNPKDPGTIIEIRPGGHRVAGRFEGRRFVPLTTRARRKAAGR